MQLKNYLISAFGKFSLVEIRNENIIAFSKKLLTESRQGKKLLLKTVSNILSRLKGVRRFALLRGYEVNFVPEAIKIPLQQSQIRILTTREENKLLRHLKNHFDLTALGILLSLFTGLRLGELCALKWNDFSFTDKEFYVQRTMQRLHNLAEDTARKTFIEIGTLKNQSLLRKIPIPEKLMSYLRIAYVEDAYILSGLRNKFIELRTMENRFKSIPKEIQSRED